MQEMSIRFSLYEAEDEQLIQYLSSFRGQDRNRRVRALMRAGLAVLQGGTVVAAPQSMLNASDSESIEYVKGLGLNPLAFCFTDTGVS
ncbi:MAG: hypothetical protein LBC37_06485 [Zoogloeaceae bacterium]|jgi:hypothetical protein|nr:hypothetical protein [Zoogloeaceae bacterium]